MTGYPALVAITPDDIIHLRPECACCRQRVTRVIMASTPWNDSGGYLFHCLLSGRITPIVDIETVARTGRQELA